MELKQDLHIHTIRSNCANRENTVQAIAATLDSRGVILAGLTDHIDSPEHEGLFEKVIAANRADARAAVSGCRILVGAEATMIDPNTCAATSALAGKLDFLMVSCNHYHLDIVQRPASMTPEALANHHLDLMFGAAQLGYATTVAHPFTNDYVPRELSLKAMACYNTGRLTALLRAAGQAGLAFEINPYRIRGHLEWFRDLVAEAKRHNVCFTLGSDSHSLSAIGFPPDNTPMQPHTICDVVGLTPENLAWPFVNPLAAS